MLRCGLQTLRRVGTLMALLQSHAAPARPPGALRGALALRPVDTPSHADVGALRPKCFYYRSFLGGSARQWVRDLGAAASGRRQVWTQRKTCSLRRGVAATWAWARGVSVWPHRWCKPPCPLPPVAGATGSSGWPGAEAVCVAPPVVKEVQSLLTLRQALTRMAFDGPGASAYASDVLFTDAVLS